MNYTTGGSMFHELPAQECYELLAGTTTVGRLAFMHEDGQQLLPVNFVVIDGTIYFRTSQDSVIAVLADGHDDVVFEVDHHDDMDGTGWSVNAAGSTIGVDEVPPDTVNFPPRRPRPWAGGERDVVIALTPRRVSGRRVRRG